jgi:hypothetical protein
MKNGLPPVRSAISRLSGLSSATSPSSAASIAESSPRPAGFRRERFMDRITESLLEGFCREYELTKLPQKEQFEHFAAHITVSRHYTKSFSSNDIVVGDGDDTGIDAIAIIVNESLITDVEAFEEIASFSENLEVSFIFGQADRSSSFDGAKMSSFAYGVNDFFNPNPTLRRNDDVANAAAIMDAHLRSKREIQTRQSDLSALLCDDR